jgi:hypothetical protein
MRAVHRQLRALAGVSWLLVGGCDLLAPDVDNLPDPDDDPPDYDPACDGFEGTPIAGATGWFNGELSINGDEVDGTESWELLSNETWEATGEGYDCHVVWRVSGIKTESTSCGACDYTLSLDATPDLEASDCHPAFLDVEAIPFNVDYDVLIRADGTAQIQFADSGTVLAQGEANNGGLVYQTDPRCFFF